MGGGSGGQQTTESKAEYAPEFRPLATGAAQHILAMQANNPLWQYSNPNPQGVAGTSPFQNAAMKLTPLTLNPSWGLSQMQNMTPAFNNVSANALGIGNMVGPYAQALQALGAGGFGAGKQAFPNLSGPTGLTSMTQGVNVAPAQAQQTVFGPNTGHVIGTMTPQALGLPQSGFIGQSVIPSPITR